MRLGRAFSLVPWAALTPLIRPSPAQDQHRLNRPNKTAIMKAFTFFTEFTKLTKLMSIYLQNN